jgi:hypothetical protein
LWFCFRLIYVVKQNESNVRVFETLNEWLFAITSKIKYRTWFKLKKDLHGILKKWFRCFNNINKGNASGIWHGKHSSQRKQLIRFHGLITVCSFSTLNPFDRLISFDLIEIRSILITASLDTFWLESHKLMTGIVAGFNFK